jgi:hypothetical protein
MENNKDPERTVIDHNGNHLLQHAVKYNGEDRLLEFIMEEYPDAVILPNKRGELPIHQCVWQQRVDFLSRSDPYLLLYTTNEPMRGVLSLERLLIGYKMSRKR